MNADAKFQPECADLAELLEKFGVAASSEQVAQLDNYRRLLWTWNERITLTRHTTLEQFAARDVLDSWQLCQLVARAERVLDVGTGGGVPGLVMAILRPDLSLNLCESTRKKAEAAEQIVASLGLEVPVYACRAEDLLEINTFETLVARAVAPLPKILKWLAPHWDAFDRLLLVKGRQWTAERGAARHEGLLRALELRKATTYRTPGTDAVSVILKVERPDAAE